MALQTAGQLTCVISQNVDGLHSRSGIERGRLAELHGCCFVEKCGRCGREYVRDFEMDTVGVLILLGANPSKVHITVRKRSFELIGA